MFPLRLLVALALVVALASARPAREPPVNTGVAARGLAAANVYGIAPPVQDVMAPKPAKAKAGKTGARKGAKTGKKGKTAKGAKAAKFATAPAAVASVEAAEPVESQPEVDAPKWPVCRKELGLKGWARYPGWTIEGDDLSGALPVPTSRDCVRACHNYGDTCTGVVYNDERKKCYFKGQHLAKWVIGPAEDASALSLFGGCDFWEKNLPQEMNAVCCEA
ncbi:hypothetical protein Q5752_004304 [Cryptotrichosporon argae]